MLKSRYRMFLVGISLFFHTMFAETSLSQELKQVGYKELYDHHHGTLTYDILYQHFDAFIEFLHNNPTYAQKLSFIKERFIRSKDRDYYSTNFFGFYDESKKNGRHIISFYYSTHFHQFITTYYPQLKNIPTINNFLEYCFTIQQPYQALGTEIATALDIQDIFSSNSGRLPILLKVTKYSPSYRPAKPHYDGTAFSLLLDSTNNQSLLVAAYKDTLITQDFTTPVRTFARLEHTNSIILIPGTLLTEFFIYPTPHIVMQSAHPRYATIAFIMRPHYNSPKNTFSVLPHF